MVGVALLMLLFEIILIVVGVVMFVVDVVACCY